MAYTQMIRLEKLLPDELDLLLARGFFRMHQGVFTCTFLSDEEGLHTVVWTRRALQDAPLPAHAQRRLRKIKRELDIDIGPCMLDAEREDLYRRYFAHVGGNRSSSLRGVLFGDGEPEDDEGTDTDAPDAGPDAPPEAPDDHALERMIDDISGLLDREPAEAAATGPERRPGPAQPLAHRRRAHDVIEADEAPIDLWADEDVEDEPTEQSGPHGSALGRPSAQGRPTAHGRPRLSGDRFDSWEVCVRHEGRLIGYSVFDLGRDSMESIIGIYDPDYARYGVGIGTMLLEVEWGADRGFLYHYAGYVVPGVQSFEYKRAVGHLEHWDPELERWRPIEELEPDRLLGPRIQRALNLASEALARGRFHLELVVNAPYRIVQLNGGAHQFLGEPWYLRWGPPGSLQRVVTYDPFLGRYALDLCLPSRDLGHVLPSLELSKVACTTRLLHRLKRVGTVEQPSALLALFERSLA